MTARPITPRRAVAADEGAVVALTAASYAPYTALFGASPLPVTEHYAPRIADGQVWLAEDGGELAGLIVLEQHPDHAMVYSLAVAPGRKGGGIGTALLAFAEMQARGWGVPEMRLYTNSRMERNIALYGRVGYRETGRNPHPLRPAFTIVNMVKPLPAG